MVEDPDLLSPMFIEAGCELIMVHVESVRHLDRTLNLILNSGAKAGVTLNPSTPIESIVNVLHLVDQVLIMSVNPGFGGQKYLVSQEEKIRLLSNIISERDLSVNIEIDGGINESTIGQATKAGANVFVAGSAVFNHPDGPAEAIQIFERLRPASRACLNTYFIALVVSLTFACSGEETSDPLAFCENFITVAAPDAPLNTFDFNRRKVSRRQSLTLRFYTDPPEAIAQSTSQVVDL